MRVRITVRHTQIGDDVKERTETLFTKLKKYDPRVSQAEVVFDEEGHEKTVEGILHIDRDEPVVAKAHHADALSAVDQVVEKLSKILRRHRDKITNHRAEPKKIHVPEPGAVIE